MHNQTTDQAPTRKVYPSDISREQFEKIRPTLESARKHTRPRTLDLYDVFCAVLYLLKSGCQRSMLPSDLPKRSSVHAYFTIWKQQKAGQPSTLNQLARSVPAMVGARTPACSSLMLKP